MRATAPTEPPTTTPGAAYPETVMVCELAGGDILIHAIPDKPLALLSGPAATALRTALHTAIGPALGTVADQAGPRSAS